ELAIHYLYSFVVFASRRLGPDVRVWLFVPREEFEHVEPATVLREGRIHEVIDLLTREGDREHDLRPGPRRSTLFRDKPGPQLPRRFHLDPPGRKPPTLEELDRRFAGKRLDLEG